MLVYLPWFIILLFDLFLIWANFTMIRNIQLIDKLGLSRPRKGWIMLPLIIFFNGLGLIAYFIYLNNEHNIIKRAHEYIEK